MCDLEPEIVEAMLTFIYTGKIDCLETLVDKILPAADKYGVRDLKIACENELARKLTVDNAITTHILADIHNAKTLRQVCLHFISCCSSEVMKSDSWKELKSMEKEHLYLLELIEALALSSP